MQITARSKPKLPPTMHHTGRPRTAPSAEIYRHHLGGMSYSKLAAKYGVTQERIGQLVRRERAEAGQ